jgi:UDP-3-O-[3-hydroxymyristoyl] glucosamine N-acyltransferase
VKYTLGDLVEKAGGVLHGDQKCPIFAVASLDTARKGDLSFCVSKHHIKQLKNTGASAVIVQRDMVADCPTNSVATGNPYLVYARMAAMLHASDAAQEEIHPSACIGDGCEIDAGVSIGANAVIGNRVCIGTGTHIGAGCVLSDDVIIGNHCVLMQNVSICSRSVLEDRVVLKPGAVIGSDGFGWANDDGKWIRIPQLGGVSIGCDVDIGANSTVDCGTIDNTVLENGVKIDNQVQIAHNVHIGEHTIIAGCVGIAGSTRIGGHCAIGGGVGISDHLVITDNVQITGGSIVLRSINEPGVYSSGGPLQANKEWRRNYIRLSELESLVKRLQKIEKKLSG